MANNKDKKEDARVTEENERDFTDNVVEKYQTYDELVANILHSGKDYDMAAIEKAYLFANKAHAGQTRKSGEPYIVHPISVANILVSLGKDQIPWSRKWQPIPVSLAGKFHEQRMVGYSPWDLRESDMTEGTHSSSISSFMTGEQK